MSSYAKNVFWGASVISFGSLIGFVTVVNGDAPFWCVGPMMVLVVMGYGTWLANYQPPSPQKNQEAPAAVKQRLGEKPAPKAKDIKVSKANAKAKAKAKVAETPQPAVVSDGNKVSKPDVASATPPKAVQMPKTTKTIKPEPPKPTPKPTPEPKPKPKGSGWSDLTAAEKAAELGLG